MALNYPQPISKRDVDQGAAAEMALMARIRSNDAAALDDLFALYWSALVEYATRILGCSEAAEDVAQEVFIRVWAARSEWMPAGSVNSFLYRIARNLALNEVRRRGTRANWADRTHRALRGGGATPEQFAEAGELHTAAKRAIAGLPERRREVFILARFEGYSYTRIAQAMGISPQTVANQMNAALNELRRQLAHWLERQ